MAENGARWYKRLQQKVDEKGYKIRGSEVKVSVEPSPERRNCYRTYFAHLRAAETTLDSSQFEAEPKALTIYCIPSYQVLGKVDRKTSKFEWQEHGVTAVGSTVEDPEKACL